MADHYIGSGRALNPTNHAVQLLAAVPALAVAAAVTTSIRIGPRVLCIDYRNPTVLAKELATIDVLSNGRLDVGLGAGWLQSEYAAMGIDFDPIGRRISRLESVVELVRMFMSGSDVECAGTDVHASGFVGVPETVQRPHPPVMIGGGGPKILRLAGRLADIVSLNFNNRSGKIGADGVRSSTAAATAEKIGWVREGAADRFAQIELEVGAYFTSVTNSPVPMISDLATRFEMSAEEVLGHPHVLIGSIDAICDELVRRRDRFGISSVTVPVASVRSFGPVVEKLSGR